MSNARLLQALLLLGLAGGAVALRLVRSKPIADTTDDEVIQLTPAIRSHLQALRTETRDWDMGPDVEPVPARTLRRLDGAINDLIDDILAHTDSPLQAADVAGRLGVGLAALRKAPLAASDRAWGYMVEVWYVLGQRSATGYFTHEAEALPVGWGEPLPPGWTAPDQPRPVPALTTVR